MNGACIRHSEIPHSTRLFTDYLYDFERVSRFYQHAPRLASVPAAAQAIHFEPTRRQALVDALREQNAGSGSATQNHLDTLAQPGTVVVATGQQVGLYGGPIFAIFKALTAAKLAQELTSQGTPAVPVFWLATEDHDLAEVDHTWVFDNNSQPVRIQASADAGPDQPVGGVRIAGNAQEALRAALGDLPFAEDVLALAAEAYPRAQSFQSGFAALFEQLLAPYGLLLLDPMQPSIRRLAAPLVHQAIEQTPALIAELIGRSDTLHEAGYHAQVHVAPANSLVFLIENGRRIALRRSNGDYLTGQERFSTQDLLERLADRPEQFSPNALLRPVIQDFILPTAVYVGGPAELAYLAQAETVYSKLLGRMPVVLPRSSFSILDARAQKLLGRYQLSVTDCFAGPDGLQAKIAEQLIPPSLEQAFGQGQAQIEGSLDAIDRELTRFDPTLSDALRTARKKMHYQISKVHAKAARESLRRDSRAHREGDYLANLLFPEKTLQERIYCVLPFLARHGFDLIDKLHAATHSDCHDHQVITP